MKMGVGVYLKALHMILLNVSWCSFEITSYYIIKMRGYMSECSSYYILKMGHSKSECTLYGIIEMGEYICPW